MATATPVKPAKTAALKKTPTSASTAVAVKKTGGSVVSIKEIQDQLAAQVAGLANRVAPATGVKIRATQDKKFILPDGTTTPGPLELVIVDFATVHNFYEGAFNKDDIVPPGCFAVGTDPKKMFPSANVPNKQASDCQTCPMNQFGSNGKGKACGNGRLLAVMPPDADADTPIWLLQPSATAIKGFDSYVAGVARAFQSMPISVVTTVSFDENETYAKMVFGDPKPNPGLATHFARQAEANELLFAEKDVSGYVPIGKAPAKKAVARR
jgi:hypothetical protein